MDPKIIQLLQQYLSQGQAPQGQPLAIPYGPGWGTLEDWTTQNRNRLPESLPGVQQYLSPEVKASMNREQNQLMQSLPQRAIRPNPRPLPQIKP